MIHAYGCVVGVDPSSVPDRIDASKCDSVSEQHGLLVTTPSCPAYGIVQGLHVSLVMFGSLVLVVLENFDR